MTSPEGDSIRQSYNLYTLPLLFNDRFIKTHTVDNDLLYNNINIFYNKYVNRNSLFSVPYKSCGVTKMKIVQLNKVPITTRNLTERQQIANYVEIRNHEENCPFDSRKTRQITKRALFFHKTVDKPKALGYINSIFRDQVWNKDDGFHDLVRSLGIVDRR